MVRATHMKDRNQRTQETEFEAELGSRVDDLKDDAGGKKGPH